MKQQWRDYTNELCRGLVRVSLAADGIDHELDKQLASLRAILRQDEPSQDLTGVLKNIESLLDKAESSKADTINKTLTSMLRLATAVSQADTQKNQQSAIKSLLNDIKIRASHANQVPELVDQCATLLEAISNGSLEKPAAKKGLLGKLMGKEQNEQDDSVLKSELLEAALDAQLEEEKQQALAELDFDLINEQIRKVVLQLLHRVESVSKTADKVEPVKLQLQKTLDWPDLVKNIEASMDLAAESLSKIESEFENFLSALNGRLGHVDQFLTKTRDDQQLAREQGRELDKAVRDQVTSISNSFDDEEDVSRLKDNIRGKLDHIATAMDDFEHKETEREAQMAQQLQELESQLESMEQESKTIKKRLEEQRVKALHDVLTGLPNREAYYDKINAEYKRYKRYHNPLNLVVADIDFFKKVNDNYGHLAGDKVLKIIAKLLQKNLRETDFVGRYGGEEFVIVMPDTELEHCSKAIEKIRQVVEKSPFRFKDQDVKITMSFGIAPFDGDAEPSVIFERADQALYKCKEDGRNQWQIADD